MNISVMSPHCHGNGTTTIAALISTTLAKQNTKVCLTHVTAKSESIYPYYNITSGGANITDAIQLTNLIRTGGMQKNSLTNYCKNISDNFDVFSLDSDANIPETEVADVIRYITQNAPYDYVIIDVDENSLEKPAVKAAIEGADCIILVLTQMLTEINRFKAMKSTFLSCTHKVPKIVVMNKYRNSLGTLKEYAARLGVKELRHWHYVHDNPYIISSENTGQLLYLSEQIKKRAGEVLELDADLQKIAKDIISTKRHLSIRRSGISPEREEMNE